MTADHDRDPRYWGAETILLCWTDWGIWDAHDLPGADAGRFAALLDAAEATNRSARDAMQALAHCGHSPREICSAAIYLLASFIDAAGPGLAEALRRDAAEAVRNAALKASMRALVIAAEGLSLFRAIPPDKQTPDDMDRTNRTLDDSAYALRTHALAAAMIFGWWWSERPEEFAYMRAQFAMKRDAA